MSEKYVFENKALLEGLAYTSRLRCASVRDFVNELSPRFKGSFKNKKDFSKKIDKVINSFSRKRVPIGEKEALKLLMVRDIEKIGRTLSRAKIKNPIEELHANLTTCKNVLDGYGIDLSEARIFVVDSYPYPYADGDCMALNCDVDDEKEFNITPGIYFKKTEIVPLLSSSVLAHEMVHVCFSKVQTGRLARGLEDGLCDLMGLYLSSKTLGFEVAKNILLNQGLSYPPSQFGQIYAEALRQALQIYNIYGLKGLIQILKLGNRKGRTMVKKIEENCIRGEYSDFGLDKGGWTAELDNFSNYFVGFPSSIVSSPLACHLAEKIKAGNLVKDVIKKHNINLREGRRAVKQLEEELYLVVTSNGRIVYDETKAYVRSGTLRYAIKPT